MMDEIVEINKKPRHDNANGFIDRGCYNRQHNARLGNIQLGSFKKQLKKPY
jgi:hypothetical protein